MLGLYGAHPAKADQFRVFGNGGAARTRRSRGSPKPTPSASPMFRRTAARKACSYPHSIDFNLLLPFFAQPQRGARGGAPRRQRSPRAWPGA